MHHFPDPNAQPKSDIMASTEEPKLARYKRIILCADGTWLASDLGNKSVTSNVATLARAISTTGTDADGQVVSQIVSYHSGLGSGDLPFQKAIYGEWLLPLPIANVEVVQAAKLSRWHWMGS